MANATTDSVHRKPFLRELEAADPLIQTAPTPTDDSPVASGSIPPAEVVEHLRTLLGHDVVLLRCDKGEKGPRWRGWQNVRINLMHNECYLRELGNDQNVAVLLGSASGGLCTVDIDADEAIEPFLALNPQLAQTLRSRARRGCNLWLRIEGSFPGSAALKRQDGSDWGEWRAERSCTMIHGIHPAGMHYERSPEVPPITIGFDQIAWPEDLVLPWKEESRGQASQPSVGGKPQWTAADVREMLACIPARPDYDRWLRISSAVWSALGEDEGTAVLSEWSPEEQPGEYKQKFKHRLHRVTIGTLVHIAKEHGWQGRKPPQPMATPAATPAMTREEAIERFYYDGNGKFHLDTDELLVPMDQRSVVRHLKLWGFSDVPPTDGSPGIEVINPMLCEIQTRRYVRKADEINCFGPDDLLERAYELAFDPDAFPPPDEVVMNLGEYPIAARGNLTVVQGKSKAGKSAVLAAQMGACMCGDNESSGDTLCFQWVGSATGAIIHLDTEQSAGDWHTLVQRSVTRSGLGSAPDRLVSFQMVRFSRSERLTILEGVLQKEQERCGGIDAVFIDGIADLCTSPNDETEALELVSRIHAWAQEYKAAVLCGLHENPSAEDGKTRGHLGSELNRKAFANLRIDKDQQTGISNIWGTDMRKRDIPKKQGFCFGWDDDAGMHVSQGRMAGVEADQREKKAAAEARKKWEEVFTRAGLNGNTGRFPNLSAEEATELIWEINGKTTRPKTNTVQKQMQRAQDLGVLRKTGRGNWSYIPL